MRLNKRQKVFSAVLIITVGVLTVDRLFILPQGVGAHEVNVSEESMALILSSGDIPVLQSKAYRIKQRLETLCPTENLKPQELPDAFSLSVTWLADVDPNGTLSGRSNRGADFGHRHQLLAVAESDGVTFVFIDDRRMVLGEVLDGYTLIALDEYSATFAKEEEQFILRLRQRP